MKLISLIRENRLMDAKQAVYEIMDEERSFVMEEFKKFIAGKMIDEGRFNTVRIKTSGGKVQRRKTVSAMKGYSSVQGKLQRNGSGGTSKRTNGQKRGKIIRASAGA